MRSNNYIIKKGRGNVGQQPAQVDNPEQPPRRPKIRQQYRGTTKARDDAEEGAASSRPRRIVERGQRKSRRTRSNPRQRPHRRRGAPKDDNGGSAELIISWSRHGSTKDVTDNNDDTTSVSVSSDAAINLPESNSKSPEKQRESSSTIGDKNLPANRSRVKDEKETAAAAREMMQMLWSPAGARMNSMNDAVITTVPEKQSSKLLPENEKESSPIENKIENEIGNENGNKSEIESKNKSISEIEIEIEKRSTRSRRVKKEKAPSELVISWSRHGDTTDYNDNGNTTKLNRNNNTAMLLEKSSKSLAKEKETSEREKKKRPRPTRKPRVKKEKAPPELLISWSRHGDTTDYNDNYGTKMNATNNTTAIHFPESKSESILLSTTESTSRPNVQKEMTSAAAAAAEEIKEIVWYPPGAIMSSKKDTGNSKTLLDSNSNLLLLPPPPERQKESSSLMETKKRPTRSRRVKKDKSTTTTAAATATREERMEISWCRQDSIQRRTVSESSSPSIAHPKPKRSMSRPRKSRPGMNHRRSTSSSGRKQRRHRRPANETTGMEISWVRSNHSTTPLVGVMP